MAAPEVDKFGKLLVKSLRDGAIDFYDGLARGHWKSHEELQESLAGLSSEQRELVRRCVVSCLDQGIHGFLMALGESQFKNEGISVVVDGKDVAVLSDGLEGEPYGTRGWIAKFGKHPMD